LKAKWAAAACILTLGVFYSFSRGAWVNYVVSSVVLSALSIATAKTPEKAFKVLAQLAAVFGILVAIVAYCSFEFETAFVSDRMASHSYDQERFGAQARTKEDVIAHPLGIGPGQENADFKYPTHSLYWRVLGENGVMGGCFFFGMVTASIAVALKKAISSAQSPDRELGALAAACLTGLAVNSVVIDSLHWRHFWFLLALAWAPKIASGVKARNSQRTRNLVLRSERNMRGPLNSPAITLTQDTNGPAQIKFGPRGARARIAAFGPPCRNPRQQNVE